MQLSGGVLASHAPSLGLDLSTEKPETDRHTRMIRMHVIILGLYSN